MESGEEATGLHAFDHLDPVSTVSALNVLPPEPVSMPQPVRPVPAFRGRSLPPPPPRGGAAGASVPPPPMRAAQAAQTLPAVAAPRTRTSAPPPAPARLSTVPGTLRQPVPSGSSPSWGRSAPTPMVGGDPAADTARSPLAPVDAWPVSDDDLTRRVAAAELQNHQAERAAQDFDATDVATTVTPSAYANTVTQDGSLDVRGQAVATSIDMDWDEDDEPQTNMRDEMPSGSPPRATATDFDPVVHVQADMPAPFSHAHAVGARPSGFPPPPVRSSFPQSTQQQSWEDDAATRIAGSAVSYPAPTYAQPAVDAVRTRTSTQDVELEQPSKLRTSLPWLALAAVLAVGVALGVRSMMAPPPLATVTLVTEPADAEVSVDGRPLVGQASPFTIQGLSPEAEHTLIVRKDGHAERELTLRVEPGETKLLPTVTLQAVRIDTGVALSSEPVGARVLIDGQARAGVTPLRVADLAPGLHKVRIEHGEGFAPYETEIAVAAGQVIELPVARLVSAAGPTPDETKAAREEQRRAERRAARHERRASRRAAAAAPARAKVAAAPRISVPKPAPAAAGGGMLRVNSRPWAQVFVDGKLVGNTPQLGIPLSAGSHTLKLVNPDLKLTKQMPLNIGKGQTVTKVVNLIE